VSGSETLQLPLEEKKPMHSGRDVCLLMENGEFENDCTGLGEEEVLDLLERRYYNHLYFFRLGRVFYAINPCERIERKYEDYLQMTDQERYDDLWSVPDSAINDLNNCSQSIFFFGESGSG
jgi:myosin heavy subunit